MGGARDYWDRMLVYFGIAEEAYEEDEVEHVAERPRGAGGAQHARRARAAAANEWEDDEPVRPAPRHRRPAAAADVPPRRTGAARPARTSAPAHHVAGVGIVAPRSFNDAHQIADQLKGGAPVIVNLQSTATDLARRIIDFASGLTYGLDGAMKPIADRVFLLTPADVEVSSEDRALMLESGFFNQS
jgi:cell division inhibitor SepF